MYTLSNSSLFEAYQFKSLKIRQSVGSFLQNGTFEWNLDKNIFKRRSNLNGMVIKAITLPDISKWMDFESGWEKMANITNVIPNTYNVTKFTRGFYHEILHSYCQKLNCSVQTYLPKDRKWGGFDPVKQEWTGLFKYILETDVDLIAAQLNLNLERSQVINFLFPLVIQRFGFAIKSTDIDLLDWNPFLKLFHWKTWIALFTLLFFLSILLWITTCIKKVK